MPVTLRPFAFLLLAAATACSSYDFARARLPDGSYDTARLIADLEASGQDGLSQGLWIPLLWFDLTTFDRNDPLLPAGYTLSTINAFGPVFCGGSHDTKVLDVHGAEVERQRREWFGWGGLYFDDDEAIATTHGMRHEGRTRWLLLFGGKSRFYAAEQND
jgi:hypothetical protein